MIPIFTLLSMALALVQGKNSQPGSQTNGSPLQLDFKVLKSVGAISAQEFWTGKKGKRDDVAADIININDLSYQIDVYLGSDKQKNIVVIDTGSADLWVPSSGYNPDSSNSSKDTGYPFSINYLSGISAAGEYFLDTIQLSSKTPALSNFQFARATTEGPGILGIGDKSLEASPWTYDNFPWALQSAGLTSKASYSLFLGNNGESGSLIFGGIDTEKYTGELMLYPMDQSSGRTALNVESVKLNGKTFTINAPALLDSGVSLGLLNLELMAELDLLFNTTVVEENGLGYRFTSCAQPNDKFLEFDFGKNAITISFADLVVQQEDGSCMLGFAFYQDYQILGDVFLRKAYAYFDLTEKTISLAQASYSPVSNVIST